MVFIEYLKELEFNEKFPNHYSIDDDEFLHFYAQALEDMESGQDLGYASGMFNTDVAKYMDHRLNTLTGQAYHKAAGIQEKFLFKNQ